MAPHVLLVDADPEALATMDGWLRLASYRTTAVTSFLKARAALDTGAFDLLVADVRLGAYNGIHLVLLARNRTPQIRTIVTHAKENGSLEREARRAGVHAYLRKPVPRWAFLNAVEAAIHTSENGQAVLRRWPRLKLSSSPEARVADTLGRVVDVSYGGVRLEVTTPRRPDMGPLLQLDMVEPTLSVRVRQVWAHESSHGTWSVGAEIVESDPAAGDRWRTAVDALAHSPA